MLLLKNMRKTFLVVYHNGIMVISACLAALPKLKSLNEKLTTGSITHQSALQLKVLCCVITETEMWEKKSWAMCHFIPINSQHVLLHA